MAALGLAALAGALVPASASAAWVNGGARCTGFEVYRCAYVHINTGTQQIRAKGTIRDDPGSQDFRVAVHDTQLQTYTGGRWVTVSGSLGSDYDGWWGVAETALGPVRTRVCGNRLYRSISHFQWKGASSGDQWMTSDSILSTRRC
jgi:hypothetical protein